MVLNDREAPLRFLRTGYEPADWVAVFLKIYQTGETTQRVVSVSEATSPRFQSWLRRRNANSWNVYVSVNAVRPGRSRSRDAISGIRHVFLEEDADGPGLLASLTTRPDLPPPSYVLHSSPGRIHVFWRVRGFDSGTVETMQKQLARELRSDTAATSCAQTTRLPGFANYKRLTPSPVTIEYLRPSAVLGIEDFPRTRSKKANTSGRTSRTMPPWSASTSLYSSLKPCSFIQSFIFRLPSKEGVAPVPSVIKIGIARIRSHG